jgi:hypothetical protein
LVLKRDKVTGEWRNLHSRELHNVLIARYNYADEIKKNEEDGACGTHGRGEKSVQGFGGKARGKENT